MKFKTGDRVVTKDGKILTVIGWEEFTSNRWIEGGIGKTTHFTQFYCNNGTWYHEDDLEFVIAEKPVRKPVVLQFTEEYDARVLTKQFEDLFSNIFNFNGLKFKEL
jgi:hypothetical protein